MALELKFTAEGNDTRSEHALEVELVRRVGGAVELRALVELSSTGDIREYLDASLTPLVSSEVGIEPIYKQNPLLPQMKFSLVGMQWRGENQAVEILACGTRIDRSRSDDDPFVPRHRILHAQNMKELLQLFPAVAELTKDVAVEFEKIDFADGKDASIVQPGISDWEFVRGLLNQSVSHQQGAQRMYPVLTGGASDGSAGKWIITWGDRAAYETLGSIDGRLCDDADYKFSLAKALSTQGGQYNSIYDRFPSVERILERPFFDSAAWTDWTKQDLPLFTKKTKNLIHRLSDQIVVTGGDYYWKTIMSLLPDNVSMRIPQSSTTIVPWRGIGIVTKAPKEGPWIEVEVPGFEGDANTAQARLVTNYGGPSGKEGFHFVPDVGTSVSLSYIPIVPKVPGGAAHALLLAHGNVRTEAAQIPSPSLVLPDPMTSELADQQVNKVGAISIGSDLAVAVSSKAEFNTNANDLNLKGGMTQIVLTKGMINLA